MALITCSTSAQKSPRGRARRQSSDPPRHPADNILQEDEDSGCECSLEEIEKMEQMDAWTKTLVAIRVLTEFKKRRKKTMEAERVKKEKRKNLWKRLRLKLKIFNIFANKISTDLDPATERILKLKRKVGDVTIESDEDAYRYQIKIEESFQTNLGFRLKTGDMILTHFETLPNSIKKQGRRKSKVFERTHSYDEMNPRTKQRCRKVPRRSSSRWLLDWSDSTRRQSWHSEHPANQGLSDFVRGRHNTQPCPIVIISSPETRQQINISLVPVVASHHHDTSYQHYVQTRPCIVSRNLRKIFGK